MRLSLGVSDPPLYDSHAHLDDPDIDTAALIAQMPALLARGWLGTLIPGYAPDRHALARALIREVPQVVRAVGLHPEALARMADEAARQQAWLEFESELGAPRVVAVGEIGLDRRYKDVLPLVEQLAWFRRGLVMARSRGLPVVLHLVGWHGHALELLRELPPPGGVVHRWSGSLELVAPYQDAGLHIALALEPRENPLRRQAIAAAVRADRLLIETDWPFGELDYPQAVTAMAGLLATLTVWRAEPAAELAARLVANARAVYRI